MREPLRDRSRLEHILDAINRLQTYAGCLTREDLEKDVLRYYGIVKNIEIIGEAARMLSVAFTSSHPEVNWRSIAGMCNFFVHEYFQVDSDTVWNVIHGDIIELKSQVTQYLNTINWDEWEQTKYNIQ